MTVRRAAASACAFLAMTVVSTTAVEAHSPIKGIGTFYAYLLHPVLVPAHLLVLVAAGLMMGQQSRRIAQVAVVALTVAFAAGLVAAEALGIAPPPEAALLGAALVAGCIVSFGRPPPASVAICATVVVGLAVGLDSAVATADTNDGVMAHVGLMAGVSGLVILLTGAGLSLTREWQRIGVRVVGSWIVAASVLVLTLQFHQPPTAVKVELSALHGHGDVC